ncbi:MAG TPA: hypothetical protein VD767_08995 [Thermomicrobiales bacterium]|nr:hypothetical protein [Thermomicrobiales bacterium]
MLRRFLPVPLGAAHRLRAAFVALACALLLGSGGPPALADQDGSYTFQCFCPLEWSGDWDGNGVFDEGESLDTVALAHDTAVLLMHEIPLDDGSIEGMIEDRTAVLEGASTIEDLGEAVIDEDAQDFVLMGRSWTDAEGETMLSVQYVQVWEVSFLLSIEYVATADTFVEGWDALEDVLLIGTPVLSEFDPEDIVGELEDL